MTNSVVASLKADDRANKTDVGTISCSDNKWSFTLTRFGVTWCIGAIVIFILAANYSNNLLLLGALVLLAVLLNSFWFNWLHVRKIHIKAVTCEALFAKQLGQIQIQLINPDKKEILACGISCEQFDSQQKIEFSSSEQFIVNVSISRQKRGCYSIGSVKIISLYPLGLVRLTKEIYSDAILWVYPEPLGHQPIPKPQAKQGTYLKREQGDFSHVRSYQRGDSLNHIAWKQMARTGEVMTKEFEGGEGLRQTWLDIQHIQQKDTEGVLSQLCKWILECHQRQLKFGLRLGSIEIDAAQGDGHKDNCLRALAKFGLDVKGES